MRTTQHDLHEMAWPDVPRRSTVLVPVGATEQHGPHLPLDTDTAIAIAVADGAALRVPGRVLVAPPLNFGSSGEHQSFAGTISIGSEVLRLLVVELVRSMSSWAERVVFINAHGGNIFALSEAVLQLRAERHNVSWLPCIAEGSDLHAGMTETSLMLHIRPHAVQLERSVVGDTRPAAEILPALIAGGISSVAPSGVLGDPSAASAAAGVLLLDHMVCNAVCLVAGHTTNRSGMLVNKLQGKTTSAENRQGNHSGLHCPSCNALPGRPHAG